MHLVKMAAAGTMESGDVMITITPMESGGITGIPITWKWIIYTL